MDDLIRVSYKYWEEKTDSNSDVCKIFILKKEYENDNEIEEKRKEIEDIKEALERNAKEIKEKEKELVERKKALAEKQKESAVKEVDNDKREIEDIETNIKELKREKMDLESANRRKRAGWINFIERVEVYNRVEGLEVTVRRLKDIYTSREVVSVTLLSNEEENGKIISTTTKISEDIYKMENFGMALTPPYYDELARYIRNEYYNIKPTKQEYIENEIPLKVVEEFAKLCVVDYPNVSISQVGETTCFDVPVEVVKSVHRESVFRRLSLQDIREAMSIYGYTICNSGRNDYTKYTGVKDGKNTSKKVIRIIEKKLPKDVAEEVCRNVPKEVKASEGEKRK